MAERITIEKALSHPWFSQFSNMNKSIISLPGTGSTIQSIEEIDKNVFAKLTNIGDLNDFEYEILKFIAKNMGSKESEVLLKQFRYFDS